MTNDFNTVVVSDLVVRYGKKEAVKGISFNIKPGEVLGILGDNGAGKSSTMRVLGGITPPTSGDVYVLNHNLSLFRDSEKAKEVTGYCPDVGGLIRSATTREHVALALSLHKRTNMWDSALGLVSALGLADVIDEPTSKFSHGMSRRLSVILAALSSKNLLILDEPFDGVDPIGVEATKQLINEAKDAGVAVVMSTHMQELLASSTDRVIVMSQGVIADEGPSKSFLGKKGAERYLKVLRERTNYGVAL